jgi:CopG family nickel-responsive transcriptional regulator
MAGKLVRFGVAMDGGLVGDFDRLVSDRGTTRSALLSDLARAEVSRTKVQGPQRVVATLTLVYDHHVRDLTEKLTEIQHDLGDRVHSTMHVHLDHDRCLEVIVMRGPADVIRSAAERILAARGVLHGGLELIAEAEQPVANGRSSTVRTHSHSHPHSHPHPHVAPFTVKRPAKAQAKAKARGRSS